MSRSSSPSRTEAVSEFDVAPRFPNILYADPSATPPRARVLASAKRTCPPPD